MFETWLRTVFGLSTKLRGDLGVGPARGDQLEHLALALGQLGEGLAVGAGAGAREVVHQRGARRRAEDRLAAADRADRAQRSRPAPAPLSR